MIDHYGNTKDVSLLSASVPTKHLVRTERLLKMFGMHPTINTWRLVFRLAHLSNLPRVQQDQIAGQINALIDQTLGLNEDLSRLKTRL